MLEVQGSSWGVDYVRVAVEHPLDLVSLECAFEYLDITPRWYHGKRFVDLTGKMLSLIRMVDDIGEVLARLSGDHRITRVDFFVDVVGDIVHCAKRSGTSIQNYGRVETTYSHHLANRGDYPVFARCYDAQAAGHYTMPVTRFEVEYKGKMCPALVNYKDGFSKALPAVTVKNILDIFGVVVVLPDVVPLEMKPEKTIYIPSRERFYNRYGKGIMSDIETMGLEQFLMFMYTCVRVKEYSNDTEGYKDRVH
ncbi:MAG: hypothetical protein KAJ19_19045 [Gammaproteobacteria bacterium]|nr:hypothetical protein [Gammaproteobacteria bacterium]